MGMSEFDEDDWGEYEDTKKPGFKGNVPPPPPKDEWIEDEVDIAYGMNIAFVAKEMKGKTLLATLCGYLNTEYFDKFNVKEEFPKVYQIIKTGLLPEVERIQVLDLDNSYKKLSKLGIFGRLVKPLYNEHKIQRKTIKIPKRKVDIANPYAMELAGIDIDRTKKRIENAITENVTDNGSEVMFLIDSMSSYDELLNDKFRIIYESVLAKEDEKKFGSSLKGINQSYWKIRNGWWIETLRDKRSYKGWQIDTYKMSTKPDMWLEKEIDSAIKKGKDPKKVLEYSIQWAPKTEFDLDMVFNIENDGEQYWAELKHRFQGNVPVEMRERCYYPKNSRRAFYSVLEKVAPYILGEVEKEDGSLATDEDLW
jgi:hypothetical protein